MRRRLLILLLIAQVATVVVLAVTIGRISSDAEADHTARLLSSNAAESAEAVRAYLTPAEAFVDLTSALLSEADLDSTSIERTFQATIDQNPQISGLFLASPNGDFLFVNRDDDGFQHKETIVDGGDRTTNIVVFDAEHNLVDAFEDPLDEFDPTVRPWFIDAAATPTESVWTQPYVFFTSQQLGITAAQAILRDGELIGVVGVDIELGALSDFLAELDIAEEGGTILVDRSSVVLAHPNASLLQVADGDGFRPVSILEFGDPYAQSATGALLGGDGTLDEGIEDFDDDARGPSRVAFESVELANVDWMLGVFAPEGALVSELTEARNQERILSMVVGVITIFLLGLFLYPATKDIDDLQLTAATDELTGIPNRRTTMVDAEHLAQQRGWRAFGILDIDHFKEVNDTHGHLAGDEILRVVVDRLEAALPPEATIGRIGGEEFLILLPDHSVDQATKVCERLRATVAGRPIETQIGALSITVSVGLATAFQPHGRDVFLSIADAALREAKSGGRNLVVHQPINELKGLAS